MNIQHLFYAVEVAKTGSISQTAESLYMGQPNLSKSIKELEETMGITIFKRSSKGVIPTKDGERFLSYARDVLAQIEKLEAYYRPAEKGKQIFRISVPRSSYIASAFTSFVAKMDMEREMEIDFRETNSLQAIHNVMDEGFKLGIIRYCMGTEWQFQQYLEQRDLKCKEILTFEYLALMSVQNPLASRHSLSHYDLDDCIEIVHGDLEVPYLTQKMAEGKMGKVGKGRKRIFVYERGSEMDLLARIPQTYMWVSPMPQDILHRNNLVERTVQSEILHYRDMLIYPAGYTFSALDELFLSALEIAKLEALAYAEKHSFWEPSLLRASNP